ncbi:MAG: hypothetical protein A2Y97_12160 [Nitrospirae bacterium RBG_13_39_12]|nr:MAG: hypothetical protein A2Y97_12160 [Nitrospirae bacterium RBG_13_39_12]
MFTTKLGKLIVVDDETDTLTPLCDLFSEWGYEVKGFTSGEEALKALKDKDCDLLLTDLVMPEMDGIEVMKAAMEIDPLLVCIIITGQGTIQTAVEAMKTGAFDYILKPMDWKILKTVLSRAMEVRRLRKSEKKYRTIVEDQTELVCRFLPGEILTFVNDAYCRYFNKKQEELLGQSFMTLIPEEDRDKVRKHLTLLSPESPVSTYEHRVISPGGEIRWHHWTNRVFFDEKGNIIGYQSVGCDITERKKAEDRLRESEEQYRELVENINDIIYFVDSNGVITYISPPVKAELGYDPSEIIGRNFNEFIHKEDLQRTIKQFEKILSGHIEPSEYRIMTKSGGVRWVHTSSRSVYKDNVAVGFQGVMTDITERKLAEKALKASEEKYRLLIENANEAIIVAQDRMLKFTNLKTSEFTGYSEKELTSIPFEHFIHPDDRESVLKNHTKRLRGEKIPDIYSFRIVDKDSNIKWMNISAVLITWEGRPASLNFLSDITERKKAEQELRASEERFRSLADATFEGIVFHKEGILLRANNQFYKIYGYKPDELIGKNIIQILVAHESRAFMIKQIIGGETGPYESIGLRKDGTRFPVEIRARQMELGGQKIRVATVIDISEHKQREEQLKKSYKKLRDLASRLSEVEEAERKQLAQELHDQVGQNLTALGINLNILPSLLPAKYKTKINARIKDMHILLENTVDSIRNVMAELRPSVLDDYGLMAAIRWYSEKFSSRTNMAVEVHGKEPSPRLVTLEETTLFRIIQEALTNAAKHSRASKIKISFSKTKDVIKLIISDNGTGFNPETVYKMKKQTVWGLSTIKERADAMGGELQIKSAPGKGTKIIVEIKR